MANHLDLEEQEQLDQLKHFWNTWGTPITAVLLVIMGGLAAWNGYQYWQNRQASQAAALLDAVEVAVQARDQTRVELAFGDLKSKYAGTPQSDMGAFASAKAMQDSGNLDAAKSALTWVAEHSSDAGYKAIAKLRLSAILLEQKDYASALQQLQGNFPAEFEGVVADRKGDLLVLLDRRADAIAEYKIAFKTLDETIEYRRLVEIKLNALGVDPLGGSSTASTSQELKK
ncbi:tetratricopeptide repeat protein [Acidovorax temperans]|uniref:YfgM family protein n=1 Tax=Acidovorax temperans TaxID=80878 RepID=UPI0030CCBDAD